MRSKHSNDTIFADPLKVEDIGDCSFYHTVELPGYGVINGEWDLRGRVNEYLGNVDFAGQRVLEIGPASGFLNIRDGKARRRRDLRRSHRRARLGLCSVSGCKIGRSVRPASNRDATVEEFLLVQSRRPAIQSESATMATLTICLRRSENSTSP